MFPSELFFHSCDCATTEVSVRGGVELLVFPAGSTIGYKDNTSVDPEDWAFDRVRRRGKGQASPFVVVMGAAFSASADVFEFEARSTLVGRARLSQDLMGDQPPTRCIGLRYDGCRIGYLT